MHSDLPPTTLRGYVQLDTRRHARVIGTPSYLGPDDRRPEGPAGARQVHQQAARRARAATCSSRSTPPSWAPGTGPNGTGTYTAEPRHAAPARRRHPVDQRRHAAPVDHARPARSPPYPKGVSVHNVPDMHGDPEPPGDADLLLHQPAERPADVLPRPRVRHHPPERLRRRGRAATCCTDPVEQTLVNGGTIGTASPSRPATVPTEQIPLVIQDKTFVPDRRRSWPHQDPTWDTADWGGTGNLWFPHVYMPNQNPLRPRRAPTRWAAGTTAPGSGRRSPACRRPGANPLAAPAGRAAAIPGTPNPSLVPEAFMDTPVVNGTAYPYLKVEPQGLPVPDPERLQRPHAEPAALLRRSPNTPDSVDASGNPTLQTRRPARSRWCPPSPHPGDCRHGPATLADRRPGRRRARSGSRRARHDPDRHRGRLPAGAGGASRPARSATSYNRRDIVVLNVTDKTLFLGPAERADVIVDFSQVPPAQTLILYNDAPAPVPGVRPALRLLHGRPGPDRHGRRADHPAGLRPQHPDHHAVPGRTGTAAAGRST